MVHAAFKSLTAAVAFLRVSRLSVVSLKKRETLAQVGAIAMAAAAPMAHGDAALPVVTAEETVAENSGW
jgi:hypothetical protein